MAWYAPFARLGWRGCTSFHSRGTRGSSGTVVIFFEAAFARAECGASQVQLEVIARSTPCSFLLLSSWC
jgi:hypothetical protein